jgi:hypothetical protein
LSEETSRPKDERSAGRVREEGWPAPVLRWLAALRAWPPLCPECLQPYTVHPWRQFRVRADALVYGVTLRCEPRWIGPRRGPRPAGYHPRRAFTRESQEDKEGKPNG